MTSKQIKSHSLWKNSLFATAFTFLGKMAGFLASLYAAKQLGATIATDIAFFVFSLTGLTASFFQSYNASVLVPQCVRILEKDGNDAARNLLSLFATRISLLLIPITGFTLMYYQTLLLQISQFSEESLHLHKLAILLILPILPLAYLNDLMTHWIQIQKNFLITNFTACFHGICVFLCLWFFGPQLGAASLALGFLSAAICQFLWLSLHLWHSNNGLHWQWRSKTDLTFIKQLFIPICSLQLIGCLGSWIVDYFASGLPSGQLTAFGYGRKVQELIPNLLIYPLVAALYPRLCELATYEDQDLLNQRLLDMNRLLTSIVLPVSLFCAWHAKAIIRLLYFRGNFDESALQTAALTLGLLSLGTWLTGSNSILIHSLYALQNPQVYHSLIFRALSMTIFLGISLFALTPMYGIDGLILSILMVHLLCLPLWGIYLRKVYFQQNDTLIRLVHFSKVALASLVSILLVAKTQWGVIPQFMAVIFLQVLLHLLWGSKETRLIQEQLIKRE